MTKANNLFFELKPPDGGIQRLRRTLENHHRQTASRGWRVTTVSMAVSVLAVAWMLPGVMARHRQVNQLRAAMENAVAPVDGGLRVLHGAALEFPSDKPNVRIFLVQSTPTVQH